MSVPGFFTEISAFRLPHPPVPKRIILTIHIALVKAFELLRSNPPAGFSLATANEDSITRQLQWIMENRLLGSNEVPGFDSRRFKNILRAPEVTNVDGKHPAKKPDMVLFLLKRDSLAVIKSHDGVFAECKPVDNEHAVTVHYCDSGINRFVNGDYAWAMQEGLMIAYVRGGRTIESHLVPALAVAARNSALGAPGHPKLFAGSHSATNAEALRETFHCRSFVWPEGFGKACDIRIVHSWHNCE
jgi:hypothetical protein